MAARTLTIDAIIDRIKQVCDIEGDSHLSTAELFAIANSAIAETWDVICSNGLAEKYVKQAAFNSVAGTKEYLLFTLAPDFYRVHQLYVNEGNGQLRALQRIAPAETLPFQTIQSVVPMVLYYIPYSPVLTTGQTFDGINGWEEHTIMTGAAAVKFKKEDDYGKYGQRKRELEERMAKAGMIDFGDAPRVVKKRQRRSDPWFLYRYQVSAYCIRSDKIELLYNAGYLP